MSTMNEIPNPPEQHPKQDKSYVTNVSETLRKIDSGPSVAHTNPNAPKSKQVPVDSVEEELMESFPASDPPGHGKNRNKPEPRRPGQGE